LLEKFDPLLKVEGLITGYRKKQILKGVNLDVDQGETVALVGHNGAGKSTLLKAVFGLLPIWRGQIFLGRTSIRSADPRTMLHLGVVYIPQGNRVFLDLTVKENLEISRAAFSNGVLPTKKIEQALNMFPNLESRLSQKAGTLSGGEQQMLALANALILEPRLLLLDEPSLGLAPRLVGEVFERVRQIGLACGTSILIAEQRVREVMKIAQRVCVLRNGEVSFIGGAHTLDDAMLRQVYM